MSCCTMASRASIARFLLPMKFCNPTAFRGVTKRPSFWSVTAFTVRAWRDLEKHFLISIDHHVSGRPFAHVNWIDPHAVATAEMVFRLAREADVKFSPGVATCLYTALMTDTGSFMFQGTNESTFSLARELVLAGADPAHCARGIYFAHSVAKIRLLGEALRNLNIEGHIGYFWVTQRQMERCGAIEEDCEGLVNYVLSIGGVEVAAFFRELSDCRYR